MLSVQSQPTEPQQSAPSPQPTRLPPLPGLDLGAHYYSTRTGGDFFDAVAVGPHVVFLLTDIAGGRTSAHPIAAATQQTFRRRAHELFATSTANLSHAISTLAHDINHTLTTATTGVCFAPTFLGCYDLTLGVLNYINAGAPAPIFRDSDGVRLLPNASMPLGLFTHLTYEPAIQAFEPGARLLLVTKGVIQARSGNIPFGIAAVQRILQDTAASSPLELCQAVLLHAHQHSRPPWYDVAKRLFTKPERIDDLTAVVLARPI
jgi:serine phosphatase RsbU (regulator of sigma subunit)